MNIINIERLYQVSKEAKESERLRMNFNYHETMDAPAQRLLNALEPGTILPIHRHQHTAETYLLLRGRITVIYYDDKKCETECITLDPTVGSYGVHIPLGQWHILEVLEPNTVIFEVKDGPYPPIK